MTDDFDLDAWIAGAKAPQRTCTVYGRGDLVAEAERLAVQIAEQEKSRDPDRMNSGPDPVLRERLDAIRAEFRSSALEFTFRAPTRDEIRRVQEGLAADVSEDETTFAWLSLQVVSPKVTAAQWPTIRDRIGTGQFGALVDAANSAFTDQRLDIPFSRAASGSTRGF